MSTDPKDTAGYVIKIDCDNREDGRLQFAAIEALIAQIWATPPRAVSISTETPTDQSGPKRAAAHKQ